MADILIDNQTAPSTPASGKSVLWVDSTTKKFLQTDDELVHRFGATRLLQTIDVIRPATSNQVGGGKRGGVPPQNSLVHRTNGGHA